ncbi:MAG: hypothetical protein P8M10_05460 [Ilumatobacter sp.]|uniref:hypothetical protein n=1 Tax=Ilumatobacter sp. TaxID=1967498 RepID=UPI002A2D1330|nr:hypothetical protein [Ilumatobacter sp.]MDG1697080.1 hypothetical protein [Ilumatobacter sp.]MDG2438744.1 hypothetical protein [Ilumatobacter sp.]
MSLAVLDDRSHLVIYGTADAIATDPDRAELTARVFVTLSNNEPPDPESIVGMNQR